MSFVVAVSRKLTKRKAPFYKCAVINDAARLRISELISGCRQNQTPKKLLADKNGYLVLDSHARGIIEGVTMSRLDDQLLQMATGIALWRAETRDISFKHGAAAIRKDGKFVISYNEKAQAPTWKVHAEARICRKIDVGATVAVVRIGDGGVWMPSKPCKNCAKCMFRKGVSRVLYSIAKDEYGVMILNSK